MYIFKTQKFQKNSKNFSFRVQGIKKRELSEDEATEKVHIK
ncbi:hypothetical protein EAL2_c20840 [Peptoclostridium acidaminophilum DSM 3953]|uniref:Uncharacterized protein n=1 Tax=Peptoclostridium acidaminophilum DSM 3953 TaxID=1286171 RepID=W8T8Y8_PEPAC|nr:hypothetical protein EAL2_c20840 [Peptoclostridium acidaminophilum DSM 3953]